MGFDRPLAALPERTFPVTATLRWLTALTCTFFVASAAPLPARAAERLSDKQLDALIDSIDKGFDK